MKILILQGLPASGKSTYAKELIAKEPGKWKRINKDLLREMLDDSTWSEENEKLVINTRDWLIEYYLQMNLNVIIDDTNFSEKHITRISKIAQDNNAQIEIKFIDTPLYECIERDSKREKPVGRKVILKMYQQYLRADFESKPFNSNLDLPTCVICDIDGTLAYSPDRNVYDYTKVGKDLPNQNLIAMLEILTAGKNISLIIVSGREDNCREETESWLIKYNIPYTGLLMRKSGDNREDSIVKEELYNEWIKDRYGVLTVFDDRPRVIRMWKKLGLMVCDVNRQDPRIDF